MDNYTPPTGPPPPKVPEGWKAIWNTQYNEWFYVNIYTKKSQWEKPTEPIYPLGESPDVSAPQGPPPQYASNNAQPMEPEKTGLSSNNPYASHGQAAGAGTAAQPQSMNEDERLARQLQAEEEARMRGQGRPVSQGASNDYYQNSAQQPPGGVYPQGQNPQYQPNPYTGAYETSDKGKHKSGLAGKASSLLNKFKSGSGSRPGAHAPMYAGHTYGHQPGYGYGNQHGYYPPHGPPMMGGGRRPGMGAGGAMALGGLGGLAGGALIGSALAGDDGGDYGGDDGGFGGDDGGDFGGDFGGGDF